MRQRALQPPASLVEVASHAPEELEQPCELEHQLGGVRIRPAERGSNVVEVGLQPSVDAPARLPGAQLRRRSRSELFEVLRMTAAQLLLLTTCVEALECVLTDRLEHAKARLVRLVAAEQALVGQRGERDEARVADGLGGLERAAAGEDGERRKQPLLFLVEQVEAPVQSGAEGPVSRGGVARSRGQQLEPALEALEHRLRRDQPGAGGSELDPQRETVECDADRRDDPRVRRGEAERGADRAGAGCEELDRLVPRKGLLVVVLEVGNGEWRHGVLVLAGHVEHDPARHERLQLGRGREQLGDEWAGVGHPFEVVEQQQQSAIAKSALERLDDRATGLLVHLERSEDLGGDQLRVDDRSEVDEEDSVAKVGDQLPGALERKARLAGSAGAGQGQQASVGAAERGRSGRQARAGDRREVSAAQECCSSHAPQAAQVPDPGAGSPARAPAARPPARFRALRRASREPAGRHRALRPGVQSGTARACAHAVAVRGTGARRRAPRARGSAPRGGRWRARRRSDPRPPRAGGPRAARARQRANAVSPRSDSGAPLQSASALRRVSAAAAGTSTRACSVSSSKRCRSSSRCSTRRR